MLSKSILLLTSATMKTRQNIPHSSCLTSSIKRIMTKITLPIQFSNKIHLCFFFSFSTNPKANGKKTTFSNSVIDNPFIKDQKPRYRRSAVRHFYLDLIPLFLYLHINSSKLQPRQGLMLNTKGSNYRVRRRF